MSMFVCGSCGLSGREESMTYECHVVVWLCVEDGDRLESRLGE